MCTRLFGCLYVFTTQCACSSHVLQVIHCAQFVFVGLFVCGDNWPVVGHSKNCFQFPPVLFVLCNYTTVRASFQGGMGVHIYNILNTNSHLL